LWEKTDDNLERVQRVISDEVRSRLLEAFDRLSRELENVEMAPGVGELVNAIHRARTATNISINQVCSWFRRNEVYDRQDYPIEFPVQIAQNMLAKTMSAASHWSGLSINFDADGALPGRTLDGMVDVFYILLENALSRSGVPVDELRVSVTMTFRDGRYAARLSNNIDAQVDIEERRNFVSTFLGSVSDPARAQLAQKEGNSGLHKVWQSLHAPAFSEPHLHVEVNESREFVVTIDFSIEGGRS
jgi:hypothetical protein